MKRYYVFFIWCFLLVFSVKAECIEDLCNNTQKSNEIKYDSTMKVNSKVPKYITDEHSVNINTSPDKVWEFLVNIESNYQKWHPEDHILFTWTKGKPMVKGSHYYAEQYMMGDKVKYKGEVAEAVTNVKIVLTFGFPVSIFSEEVEMIIEDHGDYSTFRHLTHYRFKFISRTFFKKNIQKLIDGVDKHVRTEGQNMKKLLENAEK